MLFADSQSRGGRAVEGPLLLGTSFNNSGPSTPRPGNYPVKRNNRACQGSCAVAPLRMTPWKKLRPQVAADEGRVEEKSQSHRERDHAEGCGHPGVGLGARD